MSDYNWQCDGPLHSSSFNRIAFGLNGTHFCTLGLEEFGGINLFVTYRNILNMFTIQENPDALMLIYRVGGFDGDVPRFRHTDWARGDLNLSDELCYKILPPGEFDPPAAYAIHEQRDLGQREVTWPFNTEPENSVLPKLEGRCPRFDIFINNKRVCTAGLEHFGTLAVILGYLHLDPAKLEAQGRTNENGFDLHIGGIDHAIEGGHHVRWHAPEIKVGDEITVRILEPGPFDPCDEHHATTND